MVMFSFASGAPKNPSPTVRRRVRCNIFFSITIATERFLKKRVPSRGGAREDVRRQQLPTCLSLGKKQEDKAALPRRDRHAPHHTTPHHNTRGDKQERSELEHPKLDPDTHVRMYSGSSHASEAHPTCATNRNSLATEQRSGRTDGWMDALWFDMMRDRRLPGVFEAWVGCAVCQPAYALTHPLVEEPEPHRQDDGEQQQHGNDPGAEGVRFVHEEGLASVNDLRAAAGWQFT